MVRTTDGEDPTELLEDSRLMIVIRLVRLDQ